jgi:flagellar basal-body rod protein FlgG
MNRKQKWFCAGVALVAVAGTLGAQMVVSKWIQGPVQHAVLVPQLPFVPQAPAFGSMHPSFEPMTHDSETLESQELEEETDAGVMRISDSSTAAASDNHQSADGETPLSATDDSAASPDGLPREDGLIPDELPSPEHAAPIDLKAQQSRIRAVIESEMPSASQEERDIWLEELRSLPPRMARDLLRLRQRLADGQAAEDTLQTEKATPTQSGVLERPDRNHVGRTQDSHDSPFSSGDAVSPLESSIEATKAAREAVLNNIANVGSLAFKRSQLYLESRAAGLEGPPDESGQRESRAAGPTPWGLGTRVRGLRTDFSAGDLIPTGAPLDLAIEGPDFFRVTDGSEILFTRNGNFGLNASGQIVLQSSAMNYPVDPAISIPSDATDITVSASGIVTVRRAGSESQTEVGRFSVARFVNPAGLLSRGGSLFSVSKSSGPAQSDAAGISGCGRLRQRYLEGSNVDLERELGELRQLERRLGALEQARSLLRGENPESSGIVRTRRGHPRNAQHTDRSRSR